MTTQLHKVYLTTEQARLMRGLLLDHIHVIEEVTCLSSEETSERIGLVKTAIRAIDLLMPPTMLTRSQVTRGKPSPRRYFEE